jgi:hypothetical protein
MAKNSQHRQMANSTTVCQWLGVKQQQLSKLVTAAVLPKADYNKFDLQATVAAYCKHLRERRASAAADFEEERTRVYRARADKLEHELAELRQSTASIPAFEAVISELIVVAKTRLLAIPSKTAAQLALLTSPVAVEEVLRDEIEHALVELANAPVLAADDADARANGSEVK